MTLVSTDSEFFLILSFPPPVPREGKQQSEKQLPEASQMVLYGPCETFQKSVPEQIHQVRWFPGNVPLCYKRNVACGLHGLKRKRYGSNLAPLGYNHSPWTFFRFFRPVHCNATQQMSSGRSTCSMKLPSCQSQGFFKTALRSLLISVTNSQLGQG